MTKKLSFPTLATLPIVQYWGNVNPQMYANGRHMGVDIAGPVGSAIYAACPGIVSEVNLTGAHGYGRYIVIEHGSFETLYAHLHQARVEKGWLVDAGSLIGLMGGDPTDKDPIDGASTGPHLHFELILPAKPNSDYIQTFAGYTVDPFQYLLDNFGPSTLKIGTVREKKGLRVRILPGTTDEAVVIGKLSYGEIVPIVEQRTLNADTWGRLRSLRPEWVCIQQGNAKYIQLDDVPVAVETEPEPSPEPQVVDEKAIRRDEIYRMMEYLEARRVELS